MTVIESLDVKCILHHIRLQDITGKLQLQIIFIFNLYWYRNGDGPFNQCDDFVFVSWFNCGNDLISGYLYWGEYPLSFAACLGQEECLRLLFANGVDPKAQDHNGMYNG